MSIIMSIDERSAEVVQPTMLEAALSTAEGNCNVLAGQTALEAERFFAANAGDPTEATFLPDGAHVNVQTAHILHTHLEPSKRAVRLSLVKPVPGGDDIEHPMYLGAIVRENLVLPLASFARRTDHCDFVQIGDDIQKLVVVHGDEQVADPVLDITLEENREEVRMRMEVLESIREAIAYARASADTSSYPEEIEREERDVHYGGQGGPVFGSWISENLSYKRFNGGLAITDEGIELVSAYTASLERLQSDGVDLRVHPARSQPNARGPLLTEVLEQLPPEKARWIAATKDTYLSALRKFPYESIHYGHGDIYEAILSPLVTAGDATHRKRVVGMLQETEREHGYLLRKARQEYSESRAKKRQVLDPLAWVEKLDVNKLFDQHIGAHNPNEEEMITHTRKLAAFGGEVVMRQVSDFLGFSNIDVEYSVHARRVDHRAVKIVVGGRTVARANSPMNQVYDEVIDYADRRTLDDTQVVELAGILLGATKAMPAQ